MSDMINSGQNSHDDIDLIVVLERISRFLSGNKKNLILTAVAGMICGLVIYYTLPKSYSSTMIVRTQVLSSTEEIEIVSSWNGLHSNGEYGVLSRTLNCSQQLLSKLKSIKAENIPNLLPATGAFTVTVLVSDTSILEDLQNAIIFGLENNEFVQAKVNFQRDNSIQMIANINQEISKLDSTKKKIESSNTGKPTSSPSFIVDISNVNVQMITLREKLYQNQEALKFVDAIQVLQKFEKFERPASLHRSVLVFTGLMGGLFLGMVLSIAKYVRMKIALIRNTRQHPLPNRDLA
jgi:hypothetical protein